MMAVRFEAEAEEELAAAHAWYEAQVGGLGEELLAAVDDVLLRIQRAPRSGGLVPRVAPGLRVRRVLVGRFPFAVVYVELVDELRVLAIAHQHRRPGYWRKRLRRTVAH